MVVASVTTVNESQRRYIQDDKTLDQAESLLGKKKRRKVRKKKKEKKKKKKKTT